MPEFEEENWCVNGRITAVCNDFELRARPFLFHNRKKKKICEVQMESKYGKLSYQ